MGPTRKRDLTAAVVGAAVVGYLLVGAPVPLVSADHGVDRAIAAGGCDRRGCGRSMCGPRSTTAKSVTAPGWLHPLAVARSVMIAKASAWVGALVLGWWIGVLGYLLPRRVTLRVAGEDTAGAVVAA